MNDEPENVLTDGEGEEEDSNFDLSMQKNIHTDIGDPEVQGLHHKCQKGRLNIQPDFQRQFVWDIKKSSRLIESAILGIPLPVVYLSEEADDTISVIDGQQRLTAFFSFIDGKFPSGSPFRLSGLRAFQDFNNKQFSELPEKYQEKIAECKIRTITFKNTSDEDLKFEIFERLNSGSVQLNDQELRNCMYRGSYNRLLRKLSGNKNYMEIMGYTEPHKRMRDVEYVLRFMSFYNQTYLKYNPPMKKFMNKEMELRKALSKEDLNDLEKAFKNSVDIIYSLLGKNAFRRFITGDEQEQNGRWESKKFSAALFDILMWSFADKDKNLIMRNLDPIREKLIDLMTCNQDFIDSILLATSNKRRVKKRFEIWTKSLDEVLACQTKQPRCFSWKLKKELYDKNPTCLLCSNRISQIDDAAIDHIEQYWLGGKTIPENARLVHRYCNNARPKRDAIHSA